MKNLSAASRGKNLSAGEAGKNKKLFFVFRLILLLPLLLVAVFYLGKMCTADEQHLTITEIMYDPEGNNSEYSKWIELYNSGDDYTFTTTKSGTTYKINDFYLCDSISNSTGKCIKHILYTDHEKLSFQKDSFLIVATDPDKFTSFYKDLEKPEKSALGIAGTKTAFIKLCYKDDASCIDDVAYGAYDIADDDGYSLEKINLDKASEKDNWRKSCAKGGTPGQENSKEKACTSSDDTLPPDDTSSNPPKKSDYADKVKINEIYPAPLTAAGEKEFVEIENLGGTDIDFSKWCLKDKLENDKSDKGICKKIDALKKTGDFSVLSGTFSLNNDSGGDTVFLYDDTKSLVDSRAYALPKSGYAYAFDGGAWRWTSHATPGQENAFDKTLSGKISKDDDVYQNIYAVFTVKADNDAQKFTWDFGDGHKSYLKETKHKYEKTGEYAASLKITGNGEDALYTFDVEVKKYRAPRISIINLSPNPKGSDTDNEWVEIENKTKKKINLKGWSIATGWDNLVNHPIREDFKIGAGKIKKIMHAICAFTLTNAKDKIELRDPSGKVVQRVTYDNGKKSIAEDTLYQKETGAGWDWSVPPANTDSTPTNTKAGSAITPSIEKPAASEIIPAISAADTGKYSLDPAWQKKRAYQITLANFNSALKIPENINPNQPRVLGAHTISSDETYYLFTKNIPQKHWAITFTEALWLEINSGLNRVLNVI